MKAWTLKNAVLALACTVMTLEQAENGLNVHVVGGCMKIV